jgi:hypothetical protein
MKQLLFLLALIATSFTLSAQDQTVFNRTNRSGIFGGPMWEQGPLGGSNNFETLAGGGFGLVLGDAMVGIYGMAGLDYEDVIFDDELERLDLAHGGLWLGYTPWQDKVIHPIVQVKTGIGALNVDVDGFPDDEIDGILVVHPELGAELNITRWFRISASAGYRWLDEVDSQYVSAADFSGLTGNLTLRFGWFGRDKRPRGSID